MPNMVCDKWFCSVVVIILCAFKQGNQLRLLQKEKNKTKLYSYI